MRKLAKRLVSPDLICPDHWSGPDYVYTDGPAVAELNDAIGFGPDPQQALGLDLIFAVGENGLPASFAFCVVCCRQNLKTGLLKQSAIGWLFVTEERRIVWSSHELDTTREAQKDLETLITDAPSLSKYLAATRNQGIYDANGQMRIELSNGHMIRFKARTISGGRGLSGDKVILDEAFALKASMVGALLPTMTARPHGQVLYASSAGKADSAILRDVRDRGRNGSSPRLSYLEWGGAWRPCADAECEHPKDAVARGIDCALDDLELIKHNNPTISTGRISIQTVVDLRQELPPAEYVRECHGKWDEPEADEIPPAVGLAEWARRVCKDAPKPKRATIVLDVSPDRRTSSIGVAGPGPEGKTLVMEHTAGGTAWVVPKLVQILAKRSVREVALAPGQASVLIPALHEAGISFEVLTAAHLTASTSGFLTAVEQNTLAHLGQDDFDRAVANARTRTTRENEVWDRRDRTGPPITAVVACSLALLRWTAKPTRRPMASFV